MGYFYEIQCIVKERINFVSINWIGPDGAAIVNDSRINITNTIVGNNHTSILQFAYLKETDNGSYNCNVAIQNNTFFSESFMLKDLESKSTFNNSFINQLLFTVAIDIQLASKCIYTYMEVNEWQWIHISNKCGIYYITIHDSC